LPAYLAKFLLLTLFTALIIFYIDMHDLSVVGVRDHGYAWVVLSACIGLRMMIAASDGIMGILLLNLKQRYVEPRMLLNSIVALQYGMGFLGGKLLLFIASGH
jgi:hypothetical protein